VRMVCSPAGSSCHGLGEAVEDHGKLPRLDH
jgi:hypothetical protein